MAITRPPASPHVWAKLRWQLCFTAAIALAAPIGTAPTANATQTENQIKADCAGTGEYTSYVGDDGHRYSACCYKDYKGQTYCDLYKDGTMYGERCTGRYKQPRRSNRPRPYALAGS